MLLKHTSMSSSSGGSYPHEPPFFLMPELFPACLQPSQSFLLFKKSIRSANPAEVVSQPNPADIGGADHLNLKRTEAKSRWQAGL
jgi:hypothetical protein